MGTCMGTWEPTHSKPSVAVVRFGCRLRTVQVAVGHHRWHFHTNLSSFVRTHCFSCVQIYNLRQRPACVPDTKCVRACCSLRMIRPLCGCCPGRTFSTAFGTRIPADPGVRVSSSSIVRKQPHSVEPLICSTPLHPVFAVTSRVLCALKPDPPVMKTILEKSTSSASNSSLDILVRATRFGGEKISTVACHKKVVVSVVSDNSYDE